MTDIEQKALALLNEVRAEYPLVSSEVASNLALCRAIEQHEAFRQEVSDAIDSSVLTPETEAHLSRFIIAKPDPLVEALWEAGFAHNKDTAANLRAAIEKRGGKIVWGEG